MYTRAESIAELASAGCTFGGASAAASPVSERALPDDGGLQAFKLLSATKLRLPVADRACVRAGFSRLKTDETTTRCTRPRVDYRRVATQVLSPSTNAQEASAARVSLRASIAEHGFAVTPDGVVVFGKPELIE